MKENIEKILTKLKETLLAQTEDVIEINFKSFTIPILILNDLKSETYEVCLSCKHLPNYQYRFLFYQIDSQYDIIYMNIDETIAKQIGNEKTLKVVCTIKDFEEEMKKIMNSEKMNNVIQTLLESKSTI